MTTTKPAVRSRLRVVGTACCAAIALTAGMLIWARLRLVTGVPRTALADPHAHKAAPAKPVATKPDPHGQGAVSETVQVPLAPDGR